MKYAIVPPCDTLRDFISHFWVGTWEPGHQPVNDYYIIASSMTEIVFAFNETSHYSDLLFSSVQGHTHLPNTIKVANYNHLIGVSFHSYAIPFLFGISPTELSREFISLDTFLGLEGNLLSEKIALANTTNQRIKILSDHFISALNKSKQGDTLIIGAINEIKKHQGIIKVEKLAESFHLSQKQFTRRFKSFSGFNPKMYSRITRFESMINQYPTTGNLTDTAYANGYFDQAHFIHEVKAFTGFNPKAFWQLSER